MRASKNQEGASRSGIGFRHGRLALAACAVLITYLTVEVVFSYLYVTHRIGVSVIRLHERTDPGGNIRRDPVKGFRLSPIPSRLILATTHGEILSQGTLAGNDEGFSDPLDFGSRKPPGTKRFVVLGDSMTAGRFIEVNWPERVNEWLVQQPGPAVVLMNMALDGGGLGNWRTLLEHVIWEEALDVDGLIFAVACDDLDRKHLWWDDSLVQRNGVGVMALTYHPTWSYRPGPFAPADHYPTNDWWMIVSPDELNTFLEGTWHPPRQERSAKPYLLNRAADWLGLTGFSFVGDASAEPSTNAGEYDELTAWIRHDIAERKIPALVLEVPGTDSARAQRFAMAVGADYLSVSRTFDNAKAGCDPCFKIRYDGHWNQEGSDLFARVVRDELRRWAIGHGVP